jgi:hypothetical protein
LQAGGHRFDPGHVHQPPENQLLKRALFCEFSDFWNLGTITISSALQRPFGRPKVVTQIPIYKDRVGLARPRTLVLLTPYYASRGLAGFDLAHCGHLYGKFPENLRLEPADRISGAGEFAGVAYRVRRNSRSPRSRHSTRDFQQSARCGRHSAARGDDYGVDRGSDRPMDRPLSCMNHNTWPRSGQRETRLRNENGNNITNSEGDTALAQVLELAAAGQRRRCL